MKDYYKTPPTDKKPVKTLHARCGNVLLTLGRIAGNISEIERARVNKEFINLPINN